METRSIGIRLKKETMAKRPHPSTQPSEDRSRSARFVSGVPWFATHCFRSEWMLLLLLPVWGVAQVQNVQMQGATATQAVISFDVPDPANCLVLVSTDPAFATSVNDTNTTLFPGSQNCNRASSSVVGGRVTFVIGARTSRAGIDGAFYSLALEANRIHYYRVTSQGQDIFTCDPAQNCIKTAIPPFGNTFPEPPPFNAAAPYNYAWPTIRPGLDRNKPFVDPITGIPAIPISGPSQGTNSLGPILNAARATHAFDVARNGNWANVANGAALDGQTASNSGANQDPSSSVSRRGALPWGPPSSPRPEPLPLPAASVRARGEAWAARAQTCRGFDRRHTKYRWRFPARARPLKPRSR